jgi:hypothetical protein
MRLNYRIPEYEFKVGTFDASDFLNSFSLNCSPLEINAPALWSGDFELDYNRIAMRSGLTENDFDPLYTPARWRPGQAVVRIKINTYPLPPLRIENYLYDAKTRTGRGRLVQLLALIGGDRPAAEPEVIIPGEGLPLNRAIEELLKSAYQLANLTPTLAISNTAITGVIQAPLTTRDPIADAQKLAGVNWQWLTITATESTTVFSGKPSDHGVLFSRSIGQIEWEPDLDSIHFAAPKVIITGSRQVLDDVPACPNDPNPAADSKGRPKRVTTEQFEPTGKVLPSLGTSTTPILSMRKTIQYGYNKADTGISTIGWSLPFDVGADLNTATLFNTKDFDANTPIKTLTVIEEPIGKVFPKLGTSTTPIVSKVIVETPFRRVEYVPLGVAIPKLAPDQTLVAAPRENLTSQRVAQQPDHGGDRDPTTGKPTCFEAAPELEDAQPVPQKPLKTEVVKGEAIVTTPNWTPLIPRPLIEEVGFIPTQGHATNLAQQIALREQRRRSAVQVGMPIPIEWLQASCPVGFRVLCHDGEFWGEGPIVAFSDGFAEFSFSGGRMGMLATPVAEPVPYPPFTYGLLGMTLPPTIAGFVGVPVNVPVVIGGGP